MPRPPGSPTLDLTTDGSFGTIDDGVFLTFQLQTAGTGNFNTFSQIQNTGSEQGYNTDATNKQFDEKSAANYNHSVLLAQVPIVIGDGTNGTVDGVAYREFLLNINEQSTGSKPYISLDKLQIWQEESGGLTGFTSGTGFSGSHTNQLAYDLDAGGDHWIALNDSLSHGNGSSDIEILIPDSFFVNTAADRFVYVYAALGQQGDGWATDGGYEAFGLRTPNGPNVATNGLAISKTVSTPDQDHGTADRVGEALSYTIHVDNVGNTTLTNLTVTDDAASGLAPVLSGGFNVGDTNHNGVFNPGESWVYTASHTVTQFDLDNNGDGDGLITNTAIAHTDQTGSHSATVFTPVVHTSGLEIAKTPDVTSVNAAGNVINYDIAVSNTGTVTQNITSVTDTDVQIVTPILDYNAPILDPNKPIQAPILVGDYNIGDTNQNGIQDPGETFQFANLGDENQNGIVDPGEIWVFSNVGDTNQNNVQDPGETFQYYNAGDTNHNGVQDPGETFQFDFNHNATPVTSGGFNVGDANQNGVVDPGETWHYTASYTLKQSDIDNGGVVNPALKHNDDATASTNETSVTASASVSIVQNPHLTVAKSADVGSVHAAGDAIHYTVTVGNAGNMTLTAITVSDPFVTNLAYASGDTNSDGKLDLTETWTYTGSHTVSQAEIDNGGVVDPGLKLTNTATADSGQTDPQTASASVNVIQNPVLTVSKTADHTSVDHAGEMIAYTVTVGNGGNMTLTGITVSDPFVTNLAYASGDANNNGKLDLTETWTYNGSHTVTQAEIDNGGVFDPNLAITNTATADSAQTAPVTASASVAVAQNPDLDITKTADVSSVHAAGDLIHYTVTVADGGNMTLTGVTVTDPLVTNLAYASGDTNSDGKLDLTETWTYTGSHTVTQAEIDNGGAVDPNLKITNTATADSTQSAAESASASVAVVQNPDLDITKTADTSMVHMASDVIHYTVTVSNGGNMTLTGITVTDPSTTLTYASGDTNSDGKLDLTETWTYTGSHTVTQGEIDSGGPINNTATADSDQSAPESASASVAVAHPAMTVSMVAVDYLDNNNDGVADAGDVINFAYTETNTGNVALHDVGVADVNGDVIVSNGFIGTLAVGASDSTTATGTHAINSTDVSNGFFDAEATATADEVGAFTGTVHTVLADLHPHV